MNGNGFLKKLSICIGILIVFGSGVAGYTDVKNQAQSNEEDLIELKMETKEDISDMKKDIRDLLVRTTRALTILEELKSSN